jgi:hypothetical protein
VINFGVFLFPAKHNKPTLIPKTSNQIKPSLSRSLSSLIGTNKWLDVPLESSDSFLCIAPREMSALEALHEKYLQFDNADKSTNIKRESSWAKNFFLSSLEVVFPFS